MLRRRLCLIGCLSVVLLVAPPQACATDPIGVCTQHLRALGRALARYQRDRGSYPPYLSALYPKYVRQKGVFLCPADRSRGRGAQPFGRDPRLPVSYTYEWSTARITSGWQLGNYQPGPKSTLRDAKAAQRVNFGDAVPVVRCTHHIFCLNLTASGRVYRSGFTWELDPQVLPSVAACLVRDLKAGQTTFAKRWSMPALAGYLNTMTESSAAVPQSLRLRLAQIAERLDAMAGRSARPGSAYLYMAAASAWHLAGRVPLATASYEQAMASPELRLVAGMSLMRMYESIGQPQKADEALSRFDPSLKLIGSEAPDFTLRDVSGSAVRLSEFRGKVVLLSFLTFG